MKSLVPSRSPILISTVPVFLIVGLNLIVEKAVLSLLSNASGNSLAAGEHSLITLSLLPNAGLAGGILSQLRPEQRQIYFSTIAGFIVFGYMILSLILPAKSLRVRLCFSVIMGGIISNAVDRLRFGIVWDYIQIHDLFLNVADLFQWAGYIALIFCLKKDWPYFWPSRNVRGTRWINPQFQLKYCSILVAMGFCFVLISGLYTFGFMKFVLGPAFGPNEDLLRFFIRGYAVVGGVFLVSLVALGKFLSHKIAGPIFSFEKYVDDLIQGSNKQFKLRSGDEFRQLEATANNLRRYFRK